MEQVKETVAKGGKIAYGSLDYKIDNASLREGNFFEPMILEDIPKDSPAYTEELFGPVFNLFKVATNIEAL